MGLWKFNEGYDIHDLLRSNIPENLKLPGSQTDKIEYFSNGDRMTIDLANRELEYDSANPGSMASSRLSMKLHMWFSKGIISPIQYHQPQQPQQYSQAQQVRQVTQYDLY